MEKESGRISEEKKKERRFVLALLTEHFSSILGHLLFLCLLGATVWAGCRMSLALHTAERFFYLALILLSGFSTALCFIKLYLPGLVEWATDSLLSPRRRLEAPAPLLSQPRNLIIQRRFSEAEELLLACLEKYPLDPAVTFILAELYTLHDPSAPKMEALCGRYFREGPKNTSRENVKILLLYSDLLIREKREEEARKVLERELEKSLYLPDECSSIRNRLSILHNATSSAEEKG
ncbi:MAG: hypothetical protein J6A21_06890 [Lentisphaeria bacterium]|nr:hypothetical protein [Lentisphaeria bacterium]